MDETKETKGILERKQGAVLKADIHSFFDCILHDKLFQILRERIREEDVLGLIRKIIKTPALEKSGEMREKTRGVYQGAAVSPVLSNIYMLKLDRLIEQETFFYVRYSDDMLLFFVDEKEAESYRKKLSVYLEEFGLELNEDKTQIVSFDDGFEFLGYRFDKSGMSIPEKAENQLAERLEMVWLDSSCQTLQARMEKGAEILGGWEQYFKGERSIHSILEYAVWVYQMRKNGKLMLEKMKELRGNFVNPYKDVMLFLAAVWREAEMAGMELDEYEQYYSLDQLDHDIVVDPTVPLFQELVGVYRKYTIQETEEIKTELIQIYADMKLYQKAAALEGRSERESRELLDIKLFQVNPGEDAGITLSSEELLRYMELFTGREDVYALDILSERNIRRSEEVLQPLLPEVIKNHLEGKQTISTYIQRSNGTAKYLVLDLDISKGVLLQANEEEKQQYMKKCLQIASGIRKEMRHMGLNTYLEQSGCRGYHIWLFFSEWLSVRYINLLSDIIETNTNVLWKDSGIQVEFFPNKTRVKNGKRGQVLKLPWGIHPKTGIRSAFLNEQGQYYSPQKEILQDIVSYTGNTVKRILSSNRQMEAAGEPSVIKEIDRDLQEFGEIGEAVKIVLDSCNLLRYLCQKARKTHYLTHFERLTVLYVFGHMGDEGKEFIHKVMSFTLNYSYQTTQKFILHCPEKPVSCLKLREQYRQISAEAGCSCNFRRTKNCYPSPVLHALKNADENSQITMPVSRTIPAAQQQALKEEINAGIAVQSIAEKLIELRRQKRSLDKAIEKSERELARIFDDNGTDAMEIKAGLLVRRKKGDRTEWVIEL